MIRGFQWDIARQVERLDWLIAQLPRYAEWGYQELYLHLEDAIEYPSLPGVARSDAYSHQEVGRLVAAATKVGIKVVPIVNLLGHTRYLIKVPALRDLNELRAPDDSPLEQGQICPLDPRTLEVAEKLLRDVAPFCTAGKVHVGLDESFHLGKCPRCQADVRRRGRAAHFADYAQRLANLTREQGLRMGMWADMLYFLPDAIRLLPRDVAVYEWYYYKFGRRPRVELFNFAESDIGERLRARGLEYWGCPMNGAFRFEPLPHFRDRLDNVVAWWRRCHRLNAAGFLMTSWEPNRLAQELTTTVDAAAASLWLDADRPGREAMLARGFARLFGGDGRQAAKVALGCDRYPFAGYPRWEINSRWDVVSRREPLAGYRHEQKHFARLARDGASKRSSLPVALRASVEFRRYLAARDVFVREAQRDRDRRMSREMIARQRKEIATALRAARVMWARTRHARTIGPNERMLLADEARLKALARGEAVLGGPWQLCYRVHNPAPAVQNVGVEQQLADGSWQRWQACYTIEFQARAARPRGRFRREHAAPIDWDGNLQEPPRLRFVLAGVGEVRVVDAVLTDGVTTLPVRRRAMRLGRPALKQGWPEFREEQAKIEILLSRRPGRKRPKFQR